TAAPVFREVAQAALRILGVVPDVVKPGPPPAEGEEVYEDLAIAGLGEAPERPSRPGPPVREAAVEEASLAVSPYVFGPRAPNLYGKTLRRVLEETSRAGLRVEYSGSGVVRAQYPPPGAVLPAGEPLIVELAW
ncbi:MAG TPA: PASTA domain-containing protein, partial [Bryobacterales bacterium]|nr:PASTA domain-containing protein [Bryobacterales bacterium]